MKLFSPTPVMSLMLVLVTALLTNSFVHNIRSMPFRPYTSLAAVTEVASVEEFDATIKASSELIVIDYSTTW